MATLAWPCSGHSSNKLTKNRSSNYMAKRKPFLLRIDPALYQALEEWAQQELRSVNGQIE